MVLSLPPHIDLDLEVLQVIGGLLLSIITPIITWIFAKRHFQRRELALKDEFIKSQVVNNESVAVDILNKKLSFFNKMQDDITARCLQNITELENEGKELKLKVIRLREYNELLEEKMKDYEQDL
jgi:hypothetical protein